MRILAAHETPVEHALHLNIAGIARFAAHLVEGVISRNTHADRLRICVEL